MAKQKILVQDIADSLHLSRTTVSKVLNGSTNVSEKNKERVLKKAAELNYKQFALISPVNEASSEESAFLKNERIPGNIAFLFHKLPEAKPRSDDWNMLLHAPSVPTVLLPSSLSDRFSSHGIRLASAFRSYQK